MVGLHVPLKLFVESWQRQSKRAETMLKDAGKRFDTIDVGASFFGRQVLESVAGEYYTPYLFVDGVGYKGLEGLSDYLTQ